MFSNEIIEKILKKYRKKNNLAKLKIISKTFNDIILRIFDRDFKKNKIDIIKKSMNISSFNKIMSNKILIKEISTIELYNLINFYKINKKENVEFNYIPDNILYELLTNSKKLNNYKLISEFLDFIYDNKKNMFNFLQKKDAKFKSILLYWSEINNICDRDYSNKNE